MTDENGSNAVNEWGKIVFAVADESTVVAIFRLKSSEDDMASFLNELSSQQVAAIQAQLGDGFEVATVHKFQGREKDAIVLTSVDHVITEFVNDPRMLNVAVSRAVKSLTVVTSQDPRNDRTNYGNLARYIEYNNCAVIESAVYSVFDLLYKGYAQQRRAFLQKHRKISEYDSENLLYAIIESVLKTPEFISFIRVVLAQYSLSAPRLCRWFSGIQNKFHIKNCVAKQRKTPLGAKTPRGVGPSGAARTHDIQLPNNPEKLFSVIPDGF